MVWEYKNGLLDRYSHEMCASCLLVGAAKATETVHGATCIDKFTVGHLAVNGITMITSIL